MGTFRILVFLSAIAVAASSSAATIGGVISDGTGAALPSTRVTLKAVATGEETVVETDASGRYTFNVSGTGSYLVIVTRSGFSEAARTVVIERPDHTVDLPVSLELGVMNDQVTVTASRSEREVRQIPLHVETISRAGDRTGEHAVDRRCARRRREHHAGRQRPVRRPPAAARPRFDAHAGARRRRASEHRAPGDRSHGRRSRPDLAGLDQPHRDHQRRRHADVRIRRAGRHRQHHHQRDRRSRRRTQLLYGFNGFYSSNENGMRGTVTLGGIVAARDLPRPGRRREATTTTRRARSTSKTRGRCSPTARSRGPTRSTPTSASTSARSPIRSTRRSSGPTTRS